MPTQKDSLSNLDMTLMVRELQKFSGGFVQRIYQPEVDTLLLRLYSREAGKGNLLIKLGSHLCLRGEVPENPIKPSLFVSYCRKALGNAIFHGVRQHKFDRVVILELEKKQRRFLLIFEMFASGNVALVDKETGIIARPLIPKSWKDRVIRAKHPYQFPPSQPDLPELGLEEFSRAFQLSEKDVIRTLTLELKLEGNLAEEMVAVCTLHKEDPAAKLPLEDVARLFVAMKEIFTAAGFGGQDSGAGQGAGEEKGELRPTLVYRKEGEEYLPFDINPRPYSIYSGPDYRLEEMPDYNSCVAALFPLETPESLAKAILEGKKEARSDEEKEEQFRSKLLKKLHKRLGIQESSIIAMGEKSQLAEDKASQLYLNYGKYESLLAEIKKNVEEKGGEGFKGKVDAGEVPFLRSVNLKNSTLSVKFPEDKLWLSLCWRENLNQNAQRYYAQVKKQKKKKGGAKRAVIQTQLEIERATKRSLKEEMVKREKIRSEKEKANFWFEKYRWFLSKAGNIVVAGKDAKTNDLVVKKYLRENDRYVHADYHGAASVVVKCLEGESEVSGETLEEASHFAAAYSRAWQAKTGSVQVYWVKPEQVSKTPNPGEFLARGAFVIRGKRNFLPGHLRLAVGEVEVNGKTKLVTGPPEAITEKAKRYLLLSPGPEKRENVAKKLSRLFGYSTDYTNRLVPGDCSILDGNFDWQTELAKLKKGTKETKETEGDSQ